MGAFHHLARMAWKDALSEGMPPQQVRRALTKVIHKSLAPKGTFDEKGFLQIGVYGKQPSLGESYISTGSLYLCTTAFLPLGLPASHDFWSKEEALITMEQILTGQEALIDGAIHQ
jgi:hypothetical protein